VNESRVSDNRLLTARVAVVTGGARGLGRAIVAAFAREGAVGAVFDVPTALAEAELPPGWRAIASDVCDEAALAAAFAEVERSFGRLDTLVANAGLVPPWRATQDIDLAEWDAVFAVNVRGVMASIKHAAPRLRRPGGTIVAMASMNATRAHPRQALYTATKHAVLGIVRATSLDLGRDGIRVNALAPGPIATAALLGRMHERAARGGMPVEAALQAASDTALGRMASESDVANTAVFLASDLSAGMTGALLPIDGGLA
jgi:NAD(P)-dependent dehydrogenase (short-subunit alcohol dehydrogenase family)